MQAVALVVVGSNDRIVYQVQHVYLSLRKL